MASITEVAPSVANTATRHQKLTQWVDDSLRNLEVDALDLLQLHCPHPDVYDRADVFGILDDLVSNGKLRYYGVSVETVDEARRAIHHPNVQSVQIIFNMFRMKPAEEFFAFAAATRVGVIARVPLASGLLTGKLHSASRFADDDHRSFNREGERFDKGETFSGVPYDVALELVAELRMMCPPEMTLAQFALRWILMSADVTCAIPGAKSPVQARENAAAADAPEIPAKTMAAVRHLYDGRLRARVHAQW